jgi:hypothetical protein
MASSGSGAPGRFGCVIMDGKTMRGTIPKGSTQGVHLLTAFLPVEQFFKPPQRSAGWQLPELPRTTAETTNSGHGRIERRRLIMIQDEQEFLDWPGVNQVFKSERQFTHLKSGEVSTQVVYGITSCDAETASAEQLLAWTREDWGIKNGLHYRRDVTLKGGKPKMRPGCHSPPWPHNGDT